MHSNQSQDGLAQREKSAYATCRRGDRDSGAACPCEHSNQRVSQNCFLKGCQREFGAMISPFYMARRLSENQKTTREVPEVFRVYDRKELTGNEIEQMEL